VKICSSNGKALMKKERQDETQLPPKLAEKLVSVPAISFCKIFIPNYAFDGLLCRNGPLSPPNCVTFTMHNSITFKLYNF
jgi:hypothetical protein